MTNHSASKTSSTATPRRGRAKIEVESVSKTELILKKLHAPKGATVLQLAELTGWQSHSVRGFLSATVKRKLGLDLVSDVGKDGVRRYRVPVAAKSVAP